MKKKYENNELLPSVCLFIFFFLFFFTIKYHDYNNYEICFFINKQLLVIYQKIEHYLQPG